MVNEVNRRTITFEQAEGAAPLPSQLQLKEISPELRAALWAEVYTSLCLDISRDDMGYGKPYIDGQWKLILLTRFVTIDHGMIDDFDGTAKATIANVRTIIETGNYLTVLGFLEFVIRHPKCPFNLDRAIQAVLTRCRAAYRVVDKSIVPIASPAEGIAISKAFSDLSETEFNGARQHLKTAGEQLTKDNWPNSVFHSISAVESVVRILADENSVGAAVKRLAASKAIHTSLQKGIDKIYGYTCSEEGIRHPLLNSGEADVDETDAVFMFGACASLLSYLVRKGRAAGLLK